MWRRKADKLNIHVDKWMPWFTKPTPVDYILSSSGKSKIFYPFNNIGITNVYFGQKRNRKVEFPSVKNHY